MQKSLILISAICLILACEETEDSATEDSATESSSSTDHLNNFTGGSSQNQSSSIEEVRTLSEFEKTFSEILTNHTDQCCSFTNEIKVRYKAVIANLLQLLYQPVREGWALFDVNQANVCLNALASLDLDCNDLSRSPFELERSCQSVVIGQQEEGMPCGVFLSDNNYFYSDTACINGLKCALSTPSSPICQRPILEGEACTSRDQDRCEQNLECVNGTCTRPASLPVSCADVLSSF